MKKQVFKSLSDLATLLPSEVKNENVKVETASTKPKMDEATMNDLLCCAEF